MIPLKFIRKTQKEQAELVDLYIEKLLNHRESTRIEQLDQWCIQNLTYGSDPCPFKRLIGMPYKSLQDIKKQLDQLPTQKQLPESLKDYMQYLYKDCVPRMDFVDILGETVCPYCNRMYINRSSDHTVCQFDHFFDIGTYPILAVSFYNLVPCCATCNLVKKEKKLGYSPYDTDTGSNAGFDYYASNYAQMSGVVTFGTNIYNLFYDGFFMDEGTIGNFAQDKIDAVISWLQGRGEKEFSQKEVDCMIEYIGEPVVRDRLRAMSRQWAENREKRKEIP